MIPFKWLPRTDIETYGERKLKNGYLCVGIRINWKGQEGTFWGDGNAIYVILNCGYGSIYSCQGLWRTVEKEISVSRLPFTKTDLASAAVRCPVCQQPSYNTILQGDQPVAWCQVNYLDPFCPEIGSDSPSAEWFSTLDTDLLSLPTLPTLAPLSASLQNVW